MDEARRKELVEQYRDGYQMIVDALDGINDAGLDAREGTGEWSPREVVHHLADSEMASALRLRMLLAADQPEIVGYDQDAYAQTLFYDRPIEPSLQAFRYARESTCQILDRMTPEQWQRAGTHSESGRYTVSGWLEIYAEHAVEHADQIRRARATLQ